MKIALNITIEIDPETWRNEYLLDPGDDVRADVRSYFLNHVQTQLSRLGGDAPRTAYVSG